jgi:phosphate transport system permease protein
MDQKTLYLRKIKNKAFISLIILFSLLSLVPLILILLYIMKHGLSVLHWRFFTQLPRPVGEPGGGASNAIVGSFLLVALACLFSIPLGIGAGVYFSEHRKSRLTAVGSLVVELFYGIPSIVIGIIAYLWLVVKGVGFCALAGGFALGLIMLPIIIKSTEETLIRIPDTLKEASLALGVPYYKTIVKVILPAGLSGIVSGILLGIARVAGETAPLLFTAFGNAFMNWDVLRPVNALPLLIYNYAMSPYPEWHKIAWGASCILVGLVLALNLLVRIIIGKWKIQF